MTAPSRPVYRLRVYRGADVLEEALCIPSSQVPIAAVVQALRETAPAGARVEVVELDPTTGGPKPPSPIAQALDELLGDLR